MARDIIDCDESHLNHRLRLLYPHINTQVHPLPTRWSTKDKSHWIEVMTREALTTTYIGYNTLSPSTAGLIRATHPIPTETRLYYFEVNIVNAGSTGYLGVGIADLSVHVNRLPGWDHTSYGYHGDDGKFFASSGQGVAYGPTYGTGDVVGCGVDFLHGQIFFTKNGNYLGNIPVEYLTTPGYDFYPSLGMQSPESVVETNFGGRPFLYDIDEYSHES